MSEKKVLGILAIIFGGIALLFSWVPIINNVSFFFGIIGAILGIIALIINRKNKKTLAIIGTVLSIVSIVIVLITQSAYGNAVDNISSSVNTSKTSNGSAKHSSDKPKSIGSTVKLNNGSSVTVNSIKDTSATLEKPKTGYHAVEASVTIENTSSSSIDINSQEFSLYDGNNEAGIFDANTYSEDIPNDLASGKNATIKILFSAKANTPYSLSYEDVTWSE